MSRRSFNRALRVGYIGLRVANSRKPVRRALAYMLLGAALVPVIIILKVGHGVDLLWWVPTP